MVVATSPSSAVRPVAAVLWFSVSVAALVFVVREDYAVGLDFQGGSQLERVAVGEASALREERRIVVPSVFAPGFGRPLVEGVGWAGALGWPVAVALRSRGLAIFAAAVSTVAVGFAWLLWHRATLGLAVDLAALWFVPAIALIVGCAARASGSAGPLARAWPGWLALALLWAAAATVHAIDPVSTVVARWPYVGARLAQTLVVPVSALGLLAAWTLRVAPMRAPPGA